MNPKKTKGYIVRISTIENAVNLNVIQVQEVLFFCNEKKENTEIFKVSRGFYRVQQQQKQREKKMMCVNRDAAAKRFSCLASPTFIHSVKNSV